MEEKMKPHHGIINNGVLVWVNKPESKKHLDNKYFYNGIEISKQTAENIMNIWNKSFSS